VVLLVVVGVGAVLAVGTGFAKDEDAAKAKCSEATLDGRYLAAHDGVVVEVKDPQFPGPQGPFAQAGYVVFDGNGKVGQVFSVNFNGEEVLRNVRINGTYNVKADCTGTITFIAEGVPYEADLFIAPDGSMYTFVGTNPPELVASGFRLRGTATRVAQ
jgi:hypothetical protein